MAAAAGEASGSGPDDAHGHAKSQATPRVAKQARKRFNAALSRAKEAEKAMKAGWGTDVADVSAGWPASPLVVAHALWLAVQTVVAAYEEALAVSRDEPLLHDVAVKVKRKLDKIRASVASMEAAAADAPVAAAGAAGSAGLPPRTPARAAVEAAQTPADTKGRDVDEDEQGLAHSSGYLFLQKSGTYSVRCCCPCRKCHALTRNPRGCSSKAAFTSSHGCLIDCLATSAME